jgi:hypothetical protein
MQIPAIPIQALLVLTQVRIGAAVTVFPQTEASPQADREVANRLFLKPYI